jgi:acyl-CoA thioesterase I
MNRLMTVVRRALLVPAVLVAVGASSACGRSSSVSDTAQSRPADSTHQQDAERTSETASVRPRIVFLGDSLTAGYGLEQDQSVPSLVQARLRREGYAYEVVNAGVSGDTSAGGLSRLEWSLDGDVKVLVIELGANDGLRGLPVDQLKRNLAAIITRAKQRNIQVVLTGMEAPPNFGPAYTASFRKVYRDLAAEQDVVFVPFYLEDVAGRAELNIADGIHPNPEGARIVEKNLWKALEPLLEKDRG